MGYSSVAERSVFDNKTEEHNLVKKAALDCSASTFGQGGNFVSSWHDANQSTALGSWHACW